MTGASGPHLMRPPGPAGNSRAPALVAAVSCGIDLSADWLRVPHPLPQSCFGAAIPIAACYKLAEPMYRLLPTEVRLATQARRIAFLAGRLCAELALSDFGVAGPVLRGDTGEPLWPQGTIGSISHTNEVAYAVAMPSTHCAGIGIDSELIVDRRGAGDIQAVCCTDRECKRLFDGRNDEWTATVIFSVKEAFYKAIHHHVRRFVDFDEVEILSIEGRQGLWLVRLCTGDGALAEEWQGAIEARVATLDRVVHSVVVLEHDIHVSHRSPTP